jgi:hypothetical protein
MVLRFNPQFDEVALVVIILHWFQFSQQVVDMMSELGGVQGNVKTIFSEIQITAG